MDDVAPFLSPFPNWSSAEHRSAAKGAGNPRQRLRAIPEFLMNCLRTDALSGEPVHLAATTSAISGDLDHLARIEHLVSHLHLPDNFQP